MLDGGALSTGSACQRRYKEGDGKGKMAPDRYSIPVFATANMDTVIEALPGCWGDGNEKKYESVTAWSYVQERMAALYEGK
jgi:isopenicillin N synthase-like dioxygenase